MEDKELDKTKPIKMLDEITGTRASRSYDEEETSRTEKYKDAVEKVESLEREEVAEEALAEKNIAMAEALLEVEAEAPLSKSEEQIEQLEEIPPKKENVFDKLKTKWESLTKKQKTIGIVILAFVIILIVALIVILAVSGKEDEKPAPGPEIKEEESAPVVVDNYYYKDGVLHLLNENDEELGVYQCKNKDSNLCYVGLNKNQDTFDVTKLVTSTGTAKQLRLPIYNNNYVFIYDNKTEDAKEMILYSIKEQKDLSTYKTVKGYDDNYVIVEEDNGLYGLLQIGEKVEEVIEPEYLSLGLIDGQKNLLGKTKKGYVLVSKDGKVESKELSANYVVKYYNDYYLVALVGDEYNVYDYDGQLIDGGYDFATVKDEFIALVDGKKLYVRGKENTKYNEEAVQLESKNYVKTYVYDEEGYLSETKRSFDINVKDEIIEISIYGGDEEISYVSLDMIEANLNKQYDYVNYFAGKLYFYKDQKKTELLGTYTCASKNFVTDEDTEYKSCFVADDTVFETNDMMTSKDMNRKSRTPIINYRYVFIKDGAENIGLYDLTSNNSRPLSSYAKVNTYTPNNDYKITTTSGQIDVVVLNKTGKYGMISIDGSSVTVKHNFNYNRMEKIGDNILVQDTNSYWKVIYGNGTTSEIFPERITGYNANTKYFKTLNGGNYSVFDDTGKKIVEDKYLYVELYNDYYAALDQNRELSVYDYTGKKLTNSTALIGDYVMANTDNPAFKVKKDGENFIVSVWDGTKYTEVTLGTGVIVNPGSGIGTEEPTE